MYDTCVLQEVDNFRYLGLTLHRNGNVKCSQQVLIKQSIKAKAVVDKYLRKHKHTPVKNIFKLFDTLVRPIILFNCEIWGINVCKEIEQFHLSFMKSVLGVKPTTNSCLIYAETGRYPLYINVYTRIIKYWLKLVTMPEHKYVCIVYNMSSTCYVIFLLRVK